MRKQLYEVVYVSADGDEVCLQVEAVSKKSLGEILEKRSVKPIHIQCVTDFKGSTTRAISCTIFLLLSILFCFLQILAYYGASLQDNTIIADWENSTPTMSIVLESAGLAFGYSSGLFLSLIFGSISLLIARNSIHKGKLAKWSVFILLWWAINFVFYTNHFMNA